MSRNRIILLTGGAAAIIIIVLLVWLGISRLIQPAKDKENFTYTNSITKEVQNGTTSAQNQQESGKPLQPVTNEISISGLDKFFSQLNQTQANQLLYKLTTFLRARVGANTGQAAIVDAKISQTNRNPNIYKCTMDLVAPASRYNLTITIPTDLNLSPDVVFEEVWQ